jgi:hypothetical protein
VHRQVVVLLLAGLLISGCSESVALDTGGGMLAGHGPLQVSATSQNVVGDWRGSGGTAITFTADGRYRATRWPLWNDGGQVDARGRWTVGTADGALDAEVDLNPNGLPELASTRIFRFTDFDGSAGLCPEEDGDAICPFGELHRVTP